MRKYQVASLSNAIMDVIIELSESDVPVEKQGLVVGSFQLVDLVSQQKLLKEYNHIQPSLVSGGAVVNSMIAFAQLGGKVNISASIGDDNFGKSYKAEIESLGIDLGIQARKNKATGTCVALISPNAERTMCTNLACAAELVPEDVQTEIVKNSDWIFIEGYVLANNESSQNAVYKLVELAKEHKTKIAITFAAEFVTSIFKEQLTKISHGADLLFANIHEAESYTGVNGAKECLEELKSLCQHVVVTDGADGVYICEAGKNYHVPAVPSKPVDLLGAGDMFAGAYLYGIQNGYSVEDSARKANYLAHKVIEQVGARLSTDVILGWNKA